MAEVDVALGKGHRDVQQLVDGIDDKVHADLCEDVPCPESACPVCHNEQNGHQTICEPHIVLSEPFFLYEGPVDAVIDIKRRDWFVPNDHVFLREHKDRRVNRFCLFSNNGKL